MHVRDCRESVASVAELQGNPVPVVWEGYPPQSDHIPLAGRVRLTYPSPYTHVTRKRFVITPDRNGWRKSGHGFLVLAHTDESLHPKHCADRQGVQSASLWGASHSGQR